MAARANPLDRQTIDLARADPCVRLLNATASIGCATPRDGVTVPLHTLLVAEDLEAAATGGGGPRAILMASALFTAANVQSLRNVTDVEAAKHALAARLIALGPPALWLTA